MASDEQKTNDTLMRLRIDGMDSFTKDLQVQSIKSARARYPDLKDFYAFYKVTKSLYITFAYIFCKVQCLAKDKSL